MGLVLVGYTAKLVYAMACAGSTRLQGTCAVREPGPLIAMCMCCKYASCSNVCCKYASCSSVRVANMHVRQCVCGKYACKASTSAQALKENQRLKEEVAEEHQRKQVAVDYLLGVTTH